MSPGQPRRISVAAAQLQARLLNESEASLASIDQCIQEAAQAKVDLLVLPECAYPAYILGSETSYRAGDHLKSDEFLAWLAKRTARAGLHVICGFVEERGDHLHNSAVVLDARGRELGRVRKRFLWNVDHEWFAPGDSIQPIDSELGRIGVVICAEARCPEILATLAGQGIDLVALPTCWINACRQPGCFSNPQPEFMIPARAREFGVPFVCADKFGLEMTTGYVGMSCIVDAGGQVLAQAGPTGEGLTVAQISPSSTQKAWISQRQQARLLSNEPPVATSAPAQPCKITLMSELAMQRRATEAHGAEFFSGLTDGPILAGLRHEQTARPLIQAGQAAGATVLAWPDFAEVREIAGVRIGCLAGQWISSYAPARTLALEGAELVVLFDEPTDMGLLRTRAVENRIYLAAIGPEAAALIAPDGSVLGETAHELLTIDIDPATARDKSLCPRTDAFAERTPSLYKL